MQKELLGHYRGVGKLRVGNKKIPVLYHLKEYQVDEWDGKGGQTESATAIRGYIQHAEGHPAWHPIAPPSKRPGALTMQDGRKLDVILENELGWVTGIGPLRLKAKDS